ncbi:hypothetical protein HPB50_017516 [Hyalomma asiaticum]|uniref:Uncharacterized protein n=1 Tax=Hyalomma asiaticum TaxID=266040 RepID=A0ACB7RY61_HYAAI|nr:hypothetical protein HPB50_017516 [Hyalomma asiaticum]
MAEVRLAHVLVALCGLGLFGCLVVTRLGYVHVRVNWPQFRDIADIEVKHSVAFNDVALVRPPVRYVFLKFSCAAFIFFHGLLHHFGFKYSSWPDSVKKRVTCDVMPVWFPKEGYYQWWAMFRPCTTQRLFLPSMLSNEDAVLYVDTDVVFVHPVEDFWRKFYAMNEWQMAGMAPETEDVKLNYYLTKALHPFVKPFGKSSCPHCCEFLYEF